MHGSKLNRALLIGLLALGGAAAAAQPPGRAAVQERAGGAVQIEASGDKKAAATVHRHLQAAIPNFSFRVLGPSAIPSLYEVLAEDGTFLYVAEDGSRMIVGDLYRLSAAGIDNRTEGRRAAMRRELLAAVAPGDMIRFVPKESTPRASVWVFTDIDCGFCRRFHNEMQEINRLGIAVNYLAFPRAGPRADNLSTQKMVTAWCADNPADALTKMKNEIAVPLEICTNHPVEEQYKLGVRMGVTGTPFMVTADGQILPGYRPAAELARGLGL